MLANGDLERAEEQEHAALHIVRPANAKRWWLSPGAAGVLLASRAGCERIQAPAVTACSKIGAGDYLVAGIALALARDHSLRDAVRFDVATGAAAVMNSGTELCNRADAERLFAQIG
jgi:6-phosphofructokinase 2